MFLSHNNMKRLKTSAIELVTSKSKKKKHFKSLSQTREEATELQEQFHQTLQLSFNRVKGYSTVNTVNNF